MPQELDKEITDEAVNIRINLLNNIYVVDLLLHTPAARNMDVIQLLSSNYRFFYFWSVF